MKRRRNTRGVVDQAIKGKEYLRFVSGKINFPAKITFVPKNTNSSVLLTIGDSHLRGKEVTLSMENPCKSNFSALRPALTRPLYIPLKVKT